MADSSTAAGGTALAITLVTPRAGSIAVSKHRIEDLALFGGPRAFPEPLHVGYPHLGDRGALRARLDGILDSRRLTNRGPLVREFEHRIAAYTGVRHCIAMCNATVALEIVTRALGLEGEVIVPAMTFVATAHALQWQRITPVFCDIDPRTQTLDPRQVERLVTPRTTGIVGVHLWGRACDVDGLQAVARAHGLRLVFDAAHAFGCSYRGRMLGGFGDAEVLSFHATKVLNAFEGGAVLTNDDALAEKVRLMQNFGFAGQDRVIHIGTNGKMSEMAAAMGLTSLESFDAFVAGNRSRHRAYRRELTGLPGLRILDVPPGERANYHYVVAEVDAERFGLARDELLELLRAENVLARRYFYPGVHRMEPYRSLFPHAHLLLPHTERLLRRVLVFPNGEQLDTQGIERIAELLHLVHREAGAIRRRLRPLRTSARPGQGAIRHVHAPH